MKCLRFASLVVALLTCVSIYASADLVVFSYNRPLQLYALLESVEKYMTGLGTIQVIYRYDNQNYYEAYAQVHNDFPHVIFKAQGYSPQDDFKQLTLESVFSTPSKYVIFAVDDDVVKDYVDIHDCVTHLETTNAYGFYLRMGLNLTQAYPNQSQPKPPFNRINQNVYAWRFNEGFADWGYPNTVDMTVYAKKDIEAYLRNANYIAPNSLEGNWAGQAHLVIKRVGLCYGTTKIVNIPLNIVQKEWVTNNMNAYSADELLRTFNNGFKIAIEDLFKFNNKAAHMNFYPRFIRRVS